jgi:H+/gluconate symporter-like permease
MSTLNGFVLTLFRLFLLGAVFNKLMKISSAARVIASVFMDHLRPGFIVRGGICAAPFGTSVFSTGPPA